MDSNVLKHLTDVGYSDGILTIDALNNALKEGPKCVEYVKIVSFLTNELRSLCSIDEEVNIITSPEDSIAFLMELSSFLKELGCPYENLTQGHISDRLNAREDRLLLLEYLTTELMTARILQEKKPDKKIELKLKESRQAANLKKLLVTLRFPKPPPNISVNSLFQKLLPSVENIIKTTDADVVGAPICNFTLNNQQWGTLGKVQKDLHDEYTIRREMLLKRLDCTIQSFQWSDKMKGKENLIEDIYANKRKALRVEPDVGISDLLSARNDLAIIEKTDSASVRKNTKTAINRVIIGQVPDRGGRTSEQAPPPPEMPSWQQRQPGPSGGGGGRGRGDFGNRGRGDFGGRGGFNSRGGIAGNYNDGNSRGGNYNDGNSRGGNLYSDNNKGRDGNYDKSFNNQRTSYDASGSYTSSYGSSNYGNSKPPATYGGFLSNMQSEKGSSYGSSKSYDSAGSYSYNDNGNNDYQNQPKRHKTYDSFQTNKTTHADQYVQDNQQNQQYQRRGKSNYNRGGRGNNRQYY